MKTQLVFAALFAFAAVILGAVTPKITQNALYFRDISWIDTHTAIALTQDGSVFRTTDVGVTWTNFTAQLPQVSTGSGPAYLYPNPVDPNIFYIRGNGLYCWVSIDKGATFSVVSPGRILINLRFHPKQSQWILAGAVDTFSPFADTQAVYYSQDLGKSWAIVNKAVYSWNWGDAGLGDVPESRVYVIASENGGNSRTFYQTDNYGESYELLVASAYQALFLDKQLFVASYDSQRNKVVLKITDDVGFNMKYFIEAKFPYGSDLEYNGYRILDDSTGAVYMGVVHTSLFATNEWGNVYVSDISGAQYVSSLDHVASSFPFFDFGRMKSLEGIYLANTVANWADPTSPPLLETFITMDNGGEWKLLKPPRKDSQGNPISCTGKCSLHLHIETGLWNGIAPMYSTDTSVGLILAVGNVGEYLSTDSNELNTYLSRDGGLTWIELIKGNHIYEIGDHGGIIILAQLDSPTKKVWYTLDQGKTVVPLDFFTEPVSISNIVTEPGSTSVGFLMFTWQNIVQNGTVVDQQPLQFGFDFSVMFSRTCDPGADYEIFSPTDGRTNQDGLFCLLGHEIKYSRKKQDALCFNDEAYEPVVSYKNCTCVEDDWECDFDYARNQANNECILVPGAEMTYPPSFCPPDSYYFKTKGYRKVAGDTCENGVDHSPEGPFDCPGGSLFAKNNLWIIAAVLVPVVVVVGCVVLAVFAVRNEKLREKLPFLKSFADWKVGYQHVNQGPDTLMDEDEEDESIIVQHHDSKRDEESSISESVFTAKSQPKVDDLIKIDTDKDKKPSEDNDHFDPRL